MKHFLASGTSSQYAPCWAKKDFRDYFHAENGPILKRISSKHIQTLSEARLLHFLKFE